MATFNTKESATVVGSVQATTEIFKTAILAKSSTKTVNNIKASPAVRVLAKKLQLDINSITPTGSFGTITIEDVQQASNNYSKIAKENVDNIDPNADGGRATLHQTVDDGWVILHQTARSMAIAMQKSHHEAVPATIFEDLILPHYKHDDKFDITVNLIQAIIFAATKEPAINSWIMQSNNNFKQKIFNEINLGIAVDSVDGLFVPVIKNVAAKTAKEIREELNLLLEMIKTRSLIPEQLQDATFILSNFGKFAGRYAIPVIVSPMAGILAVGSLRQTMIVVDNVAKASYMLPLSLTFDHRVITGGQAARFIKAILEFFK